jgi:hypothetical protein
MDKDTSTILASLRVHLAIAERNEKPYDGIIRSQVEAEIRDILAGKETRQGERERPADAETATHPACHDKYQEVIGTRNDEEWLADARRRVEETF